MEKVRFVFKDIKGIDHRVPIIRSQGESMAKELPLAQAEDLEVLLDSLKGNSDRYLDQMGACKKSVISVAQSFDTGFDKQLLTKLRK